MDEAIERPATAVLMYHEVQGDVERARRRRRMVPLYCLAADRFREQLDYLVAKGIRTITVDELSEPAGPGPRVALTFDDGLVGNHEFALPLLAERGQTATIFAVVSRIGADPRYLSWDQLRQLSAAGLSIGSHTLTHRPLEALGPADLAHELVESRRRLEQELAAAVHHLSLPHGSISPAVVAAAREAGYRTICTSILGSEIHGATPRLVDRIPILDTDDLSRFARLVALDPTLLRRRRRAKALKSAVKRLIGLERYRSLYRWAFRIDRQTPRSTR